MQELIKIQPHDKLIQTVDARELHEFLEVGRDFSSWIKTRIDQYNFVENQDFVSLAKTGEQNGSGGHNKKEYAITVDMAKELAMVERNEKGQQARRYFIECEKKLFQGQAQRVAHKNPLQLAADNFKPVFEIAKLIGLDNNVAAISANQAVNATTGVDLLSLMGQTHLKAENQEAIYLTPTEIGQQLGGLSGRKVNKLLTQQGKQILVSGHWKPTDSGKIFARLFDTGRKHKSGAPVQQLKWADAIVPVLEKFVVQGVQQ